MESKLKRGGKIQDILLEDIKYFIYMDNFINKFKKILFQCIYFFAWKDVTAAVTFSMNQKQLYRNCVCSYQCLNVPSINY